MATIIRIQNYRRRDYGYDALRNEAMMKGRLDRYSYDSCGEEFEVLFDKKPERCPSCKLRIVWLLGSG